MQHTNYKSHLPTMSLCMAMMLFSAAGSISISQAKSYDLHFCTFMGGSKWERIQSVFVDSEGYVYVGGSGAEDYFGYAWGSEARFEAPFHAQPIGGANKGLGHTTNTRVRMLDRIPFQSRLKVNMEILYWQSSTTIDYATTAYWYVFDGAESNGHVSPDRVQHKVGELAVNIKGEAGESNQ